MKTPRLRLTHVHPEPVIRRGGPGTERNKYGFEGGRVIKQDGIYHLFTAEMVGDPWNVKMMLACWTSTDRLRWKRENTIAESSGDFTGTDPRAALWGPMPVFDDAENRWNLFYVTYRSAPNPPHLWLTNYHGRICRAISAVPGRAGLMGPYQDAGMILEPGLESDPWEGLQGADSFFPFPHNGGWLSFYGSAQTQFIPVPFFGVGLAAASSLAGPWKRLSARNPIHFGARFVENPIVHRTESGMHLAVFDGGDPLHFPDGTGGFGWSYSENGLDWAEAAFFPTPKLPWLVCTRTPLGLVPEEDGTFSMFFTAFDAAYEDPSRFGHVGYAVVTLC